VDGRAQRVAQANNAFVFPALGLAALVGEVREVTDAMFAAAADALAAEVTEEDIAAGALLPNVRDLRRVTARVAAAVLREAGRSGVGRRVPDEAIAGAVAAGMWEPRYPVMVPAPALEPAPMG
jgi:malate dehydrogenase (oxaloacetate-decarboxylating)